MKTINKSKEEEFCKILFIQFLSFWSLIRNLIYKCRKFHFCYFDLSSNMLFWVFKLKLFINEDSEGWLNIDLYIFLICAQLQTLIKKYFFHKYYAFKIKVKSHVRIVFNMNRLHWAPWNQSKFEQRYVILSVIG